MKKTISIVLISSMVNLIGCYYQEQMTPSSYDYDEHSNILVVTSDTTYKLKGDEYHFANDTLFATLSKQIDRQTTFKYDIKVPLDNIETIEVERTDAFGTVGVVVLVPVITFSLLIIIWLVTTGGELS